MKFSRGLRDRDVASKSDPMAVVFLKEFGGANFYEFGRTEMIKNSLNPDFARRIILDYRFEEAQKLRIEM